MAVSDRRYPEGMVPAVAVVGSCGVLILGLLLLALLWLA